MSFDVLLSIIWNDDLNKAPREFCIFQGLMLQFTTYTASISAVCFALQSYQLVVLKRETSIKWIYSSIIVYPILMTSILVSLSYGFDSIHVRDLSCDVITPPWVRLVGYAGSNLLISIPGVYWSGRVAWVVFNHSERTLRTFSTLPMLQQENQIENNSQLKYNSSIPINIKITNFNNPTQNQNQRLTQGIGPKIKYKITRTAAIRMACFSIGFLVISLIVSIDTLIILFSNSPTETKISGNDGAGSLIGIVVFLIFGTTKDSNVLKKCFQKRRIKERENNNGI
ncbi:27867_t:CDS:2 [Dentiscutata erythropus]|uniref:27867_t:CDS:1 n=1 Tax=Dentiscutata erythropus TaxID=1348616 RepID=A0A9N9H5H6_9GLOM|nr:27867_t:CDS:2 [Dentiscutata erythropus]